MKGTLVEEVRGEAGELGVHAVLHLEAERPNAEHDEPLEERLRQAGPGRLFAHDDGAELAVVAHENELLGAKHHRHHALGLGRLHALVDEDRVELLALQPRVARAHASAADHVGRLHQLPLGAFLQHPIALFIHRRQLTRLVLQLLQLVQLRVAEIQYFVFISVEN